jgi:hypothetical protein
MISSFNLKGDNWEPFIVELEKGSDKPLMTLKGL